MAARAERRVCVCTSSLSTVVHVTVTVTVYRSSYLEQRAHRTAHRNIAIGPTLQNAKVQFFYFRLQVDTPNL